MTDEDEGEAPLRAQPATFDDMFRDNYAGLVRSLTVAAGDRELAADCVQEAFTRAYVRWRRISRYDDPAGWVRRVAVNRLRDHWRRSRRKDRAVARLGAQLEDVEPPSEPPSADPSLAAAVAGLPDRQREAVALFYVEGLTVREVADSMKLSEGAVKYHLHEGRERLRGVLEHS
ncbi:MAG: RNA polymerase sigma factor [Acidimicrobiia bacterium]